VHLVSVTLRGVSSRAELNQVKPSPSQAKSNWAKPNQAEPS